LTVESCHDHSLAVGDHESGQLSRDCQGEAVVVRRAHRVTADSSTPRLAYLIALTSHLRSVSAFEAELPFPRVGRVTTPLPLYRLCLPIVDPSQESECLLSESVRLT